MKINSSSYSMPISFSRNQIGSVFALCAAFLFSSKAIFIKQAYALSSQVDATVLMALRMGSALPFFCLWHGIFASKDRLFSPKTGDFWSLQAC
jgi:hypothetical protein